MTFAAAARVAAEVATTAAVVASHAVDHPAAATRRPCGDASLQRVIFVARGPYQRLQRNAPRNVRDGAIGMHHARPAEENLRADWKGTNDRKVLAVDERRVARNLSVVWRRDVAGDISAAAADLRRVNDADLALV